MFQGSRSHTRIAYINLNLCEIANSIGEVLLTLTDEIAKATNIPAPSDDDLLKLPEITFRRYIETITQTQQNLIIILDEFETLEELIKKGTLSPDFIPYLRGLIQLAPNLAFAFAGLHTLEEMTANYFAPFFASILPIHVGFLDHAATRQILANPSLDFPLTYTEDLYTEVHCLTNGQPYLIQLLGFQLTRRYNTQVFEQNRPRDPHLTLEDLTTIVQDPELYSKGRYYFTGVWQQAATLIPQQQPILQYLAHHPQGQTIATIAQTLNLPEPTVQSALDLLKRHDVAENDNGNWRIALTFGRSEIIELFRHWLLEENVQRD